MKYKLLSIDLDRTLLTPILAKATKKDGLAIQKYLAAGGKICINTGRAPWSANKFINKINSLGPNKIQFLSAYNGGYIYDFCDHKTYHQIISHTITKQIYDLVLKHNTHIWIHSLKSEKNKCIETNTLIYKWFVKVFRSLTLVKIKDFSNLDAFKINIFSASRKKIQSFYKECLKLNLDQKLTFCLSSPKVIEITAKNTNKGMALSLLSKKYKIDKSQIMSIGDSFNDKSAFDISGCAVGVKPKVKSLRQYCNKIIYKKRYAIAKIMNNYVLNDDMTVSKK